MLLCSNVIIIQSMCINIAIEVERVEAMFALLMNSLFSSEQACQACLRVSPAALPGDKQQGGPQRSEFIPRKVQGILMNFVQRKGLFYGKEYNWSTISDPHPLTSSPAFMASDQGERFTRKKNLSGKQTADSLNISRDIDTFGNCIQTELKINLAHMEVSSEAYWNIDQGGQHLHSSIHIIFKI